MSDQLELLAPAKINLFLELKAKRDDGFHELETVMSCVNLCDRLRFETREDDQILLRTAASEGLPLPKDNLIVKALASLQSSVEVRQGMDVFLEKRIPIQAGLGGASSNAATALMAGNRLWNLNLGLDQLMNLAAKLGSDVPFFVTGGAANCTGRGEIVEPINFLNGFPVLIAKPPIGLPTPQVFSNCSIPNNPRISAPLIAAFRSGNKIQIRQFMMNRLESAASSVTEWVVRLRNLFEEAGSFAHQLSGSGSCYFGLFSNTKLLRKAFARLLQKEPEIALYYCQTTGRLAHPISSME